MLSKLVRTALWLLLHTVYNIVDKILVLCLYIHLKSVELLNARSIKQSFDFVNLNLRNFSKIPHHVVFILDDQSLSYVELSRLVIWSLAAGISYFTLYDFTGLLKNKEEKLFKVVQELKANVPGYIKWKNQPELNGFTIGTPNKMTVNVLSRDDGKQKIVDVVRDLSHKVKKGALDVNNIDVNFLDKCFNEAYSSLPEPNLALYCSAVCKTNGLLPWHIRLTEFLSFGGSHFVNEIRFVDLLKKYGYCEQRFGT